MNIARQYKLYRLGVEIPPTSLEIIKLVEGIFSKLTLYKDYDSPHVEYYIDANDGDKIYMRIDTNKFTYCSYPHFWSFLEDDYNLTYHETQAIIKYMINQYFNLNVSNVAWSVAMKYRAMKYRW